ncbi:MAG TPA: pyridoxamine 5'-phosphate oxidase family protein [Variovorax sp.]|nr:pyridoxamine 5'-phosphate oxidase family protein [Variovorax sp.]
MDNNNPFHAGEQAVQEHLGIRDKMLVVGQRGIRSFMPEQHQRFFEQLPFVLVGSVDPEGRPWASVLAGRPGFIQAPDAHRLVLRARTIAGDPLAPGLAPGAPLGLLGIELHTRRRNRANGRIAQPGPGGFELAVEQSFGNCPKYIQGRELHWARDPDQPQAPRAIEALQALDAEAMTQVEQADMLFVASAAPAAEGGQVDVSHRGGRPGFVRIEDARTLLVPDFAGNRFFMTLGNLQGNPRAGLLFIDFASGDLLSLSGSTELVWESEELQAFEGAERGWRLRVEAGWRLRDALPLRARLLDASPYALATGRWAEVSAGPDRR